MEAGARTGVARHPVPTLIDEVEDHIGVAVHPYSHDALGVARGRALVPLLGPGPAVEYGLTERERAAQRCSIRPGDHEDLAGVVLLNHDGNQTRGAVGQPIDGHLVHHRIAHGHLARRRWDRSVGPARVPFPGTCRRPPARRHGCRQPTEAPPFLAASALRWPYAEEGQVVSYPAAWHPDPMGRYEYRYWDGYRWTEHVANQGVAGVDPIDGGGQAAGDWGHGRPAQGSASGHPQQPGGGQQWGGQPGHQQWGQQPGGTQPAQAGAPGGAGWEQPGAAGTTPGPTSPSPQPGAGVEGGSARLPHWQQAWTAPQASAPGPEAVAASPAPSSSTAVSGEVTPTGGDHWQEPWTAVHEDPAASGDPAHWQRPWSATEQPAQDSDPAEEHAHWRQPWSATEPPPDDSAGPMETHAAAQTGTTAAQDTTVHLGDGPPDGGTAPTPTQDTPHWQRPWTVEDR